MASGVGFSGAGGSGKPLAQGLMMRLPAQCNQRLDFGGRAQRHIGLAEITIVGQQRFGLPRYSGKALILPNIGAICCLSLGA
jgi:hypothetical protein